MARGVAHLSVAALEERYKAGTNVRSSCWFQTLAAAADAMGNESL
jgi:hypothetical protein